MSIIKTTEELVNHKNNALSQIDQHLTSLISSNNQKRRSKADKLSYWLEDYIKFLDYEESFSASGLKKYKRGDILKVHLGYNIGSEEGGLHYAVVIEKNNSIHNPVITIVPLTSIKPHKDLANLRNGEILLGNELFSKSYDKFNHSLAEATSELQKTKEAFQVFLAAEKQLQSVLDELTARQAANEKRIKYIERMGNEIKKMKIGSIALVDQITTISKIRIYDPKTTGDIFSGIRLSPESLDRIDQEILRLYIK